MAVGVCVRVGVAVGVNTTAVAVAVELGVRVGVGVAVTGGAPPGALNSSGRNWSPVRKSRYWYVAVV